MKFCTNRRAPAATLSHPRDGPDNLERKRPLLLSTKNHTPSFLARSVPRIFSPCRLLASTALLGSFAALLAPAQAARPFAHPAPAAQAQAHNARLAHLHAAQAHLAAQSARQSTTVAAQRVALAVHNTRLAQKARLAALRGRTTQMQTASVRLMHARKMALLKSVLGQQHMAMAEVKTQRTLTARAKKMAQRQQKLALAQRKAQIKIAAARQQSLVRLAKLESQNSSLGSGNVVMAAYALRGSRYVMGGTSRSGFDCSGFVRYVLSTTDGVSIPRTAAEQYYHGLPIPVQSMEPGDLVFFKNTYKRGISHVGIYAGEGKFIHAANSHKGVRMDLLNAPYYWSHFAGARRVLPSVMRQAAFLR